jgi:hypothetical protein
VWSYFSVHKYSILSIYINHYIFTISANTRSHKSTFPAPSINKMIICDYFKFRMLWQINKLFPDFASSEFCISAQHMYTTTSWNRVIRPFCWSNPKLFHDNKLPLGLTAEDEFSCQPEIRKFNWFRSGTQSSWTNCEDILIVKSPFQTWNTLKISYLYLPYPWRVAYKLNECRFFGISNQGQSWDL